MNLPTFEPIEMPGPELRDFEDLRAAYMARLIESFSIPYGLIEVGSRLSSTIIEQHIYRSHFEATNRRSCEL